MGIVISGIQQIGVGVAKVHEAFDWYRQAFGMDVPVFEEAAEAGLMLPYTGGEPRKRHAILSINMQGGGGFEIWQYTSRTPEAAKFELQIGDLGIYAAKIRSANVSAAYLSFKQRNFDLPGGIQTDPAGNEYFWVRDPYGNIFQIVPDKYEYVGMHKLTGGPCGAIIGVTNIENARKVYTDILGYDEVVYDKTSEFADLQSLPGGGSAFRRVLLTHSAPRKGAFSQMFGPTTIELVQVVGRTPAKIFENRFWGDLGFIHLCFDISGMQELKEKCESLGFPFTVDSSNSFDMGEAAGHFSYIEDPDGALIEFVETHKLPILKKINWYMDLRKRDPEKPLPKWMLRSMNLGRVKE